MDYLKHIESVLNKVVESYWKDKQYVLTERDLVARTYALLEMEPIPGIGIHCELRPFKKSKKPYDVIRKVGRKFKWEEQERNSGAIFDLCLISTNDEYWLKAYKKTRGDRRKPRYWPEKLRSRFEPYLDRGPK